MWFKRVSALLLVAALMLVPAVGRARQRVDPPHARPRITAPYRSVDVKAAPIVVAPDTTSVARVEPDNERGPQPDTAGGPALPTAPDVSGRGALRGPPLR